GGAPPAARAARAVGARSSTSEFQSSHDGQRPCHFGVRAPHDEQEKTEIGLATRRG
ncbi:MAG: hypothetical protein QOG70_1624, partial [Solirubrobacteraceae bacterium]|nr:hypothetical protein [Solirubrobacteraceae bacterium]